VSHYKGTGDALRDRRQNCFRPRAALASPHPPSLPAVTSAEKFRRVPTLAPCPLRPQHRR